MGTPLIGRDQQPVSSSSFLIFGIVDFSLLLPETQCRSGYEHIDRIQFTLAVDIVDDSHVEVLEFEDRKDGTRSACQVLIVVVGRNLKRFGSERPGVTR